jgi:hypothetical protein
MEPKAQKHSSYIFRVFNLGYNLGRMTVQNSDVLRSLFHTLMDLETKKRNKCGIMMTAIILLAVFDSFPPPVVVTV